MNALQLKLQQLRNKRNRIKLYPEEVKASTPPRTLKALQERVKALGERTKTYNDWHPPTQEVYDLAIPASVDPMQFVLRVRQDFPRINIHLKKSHLLQVEGLAEYRWLLARLLF